MTDHIDVSQETIDAYQRDGCVHIPGVFSGYWQERLLAASDRIMADFKAKKQADPDYQADPNGQDVIVNSRYPGRLAFRKAVEYDPDFNAWAKDSCAMDLVAKVIGSSTLRYLMDTTFLKEHADSETATPVHHDIAVYCFQGTQVPSLWIPLRDVGMDDAPLQTVIGSHTWQDTLYRPPTDDNTRPLPPGYKERSEIPARIEAEGAEWRTWLCKAGDVLLIHPYTLHASLPKKSEGHMRVGFSTRWMGDDVKWDPNPLTPTAHIKSRDSLRVGDSPPEDQYPVLWSVQ